MTSTDPSCARDAAALLLRECPVGVLRDRDRVTGAWTAVPDGRPGAAPGAPAPHRVTGVRLEGGAPAACSMLLDLPDLPPDALDARLSAVVAATLDRGRRTSDHAAHTVLRDLGLLPDGRDGPRCPAAIGPVNLLLRSFPGSDRADWDPLVAAHLAPVVGHLRALVGDAVLDACAVVDRTAFGYVSVAWVDDALWPVLSAPGSPALRALRALPHHADLVMLAAGRFPDALASSDPATVLVDVWRAAWVQEMPRWLASWSAGAPPGLLRLCSPDCEGVHDHLELLHVMTVRPPNTRATHLLARMRHMPASWLPRDGEEVACHDALHASFAIARAMGVEGAPAPATVGGKGSWGDHAARLADACGGAGGAVHSARDLGDVAHSLVAQLLVPALLLTGTGTDAEGRLSRETRDHAAGVARGLLFGGRSVLGALARSDAWHAGVGHADAALAALDPALSTSRNWRAGLPDHVVGGVSVVVLTGAGALVEEGRSGGNPDGTEGLSHCVGGYAGRCESGRVRVVSLRRRGPDGVPARLSTAELEVSVTGDPARPCAVRVAQHRGRRNADPGPDCEAALSAYVEGLEDGTLPVDAEALRPARQVPGDVRSAGYDFRVPGAFEAVVALWGRVLPRRARGWGAEDFAALVSPSPDVAEVPPFGMP